jgi:hypothetical protein
VADRQLTAPLPPCIPHTDRVRTVRPAPTFLTWPCDHCALRLPSCVMRTSLLTITSKRRETEHWCETPLVNRIRSSRPEERT